MIFPLLEDPHYVLPHANPSLGPEQLLSDDGSLMAVKAVQTVGSVAGSGTISSQSSTSPASTLVGASNGLQINLVWDTSVRNSANWSAIEASIVAAAQIYTATFSNHVVLNIAVGLGEVGGTAMGAGALGESNSYGYMTNYTTVEKALQSADAGLVSAATLTGAHAPTSANFFVTSAEAKALGLVSGTGTAIDGFIGISSSSSVYFATTGSQIGATQYDATGIAAHEISEVMGRIGTEGSKLGSYTNVDTPLDLFRYTAAGVRDLTPTGAYFSLDGGVTSLAVFNNPANGGDAADLASLQANAQNAYNAFGAPGALNVVTPNDLQMVQALGFHASSSLPKTSIVA